MLYGHFSDDISTMVVAADTVIELKTWYGSIMNEYQQSNMNTDLYYIEDITVSGLER